MTYSLEGKVVLVTGAASGIGYATASAFASRGAKVALVDVDLKAVHAATTQMPGDPLGVRADVSKQADCERMVKLVLTKFGKLDIAINNAGIPSKPGGLFEDTDVDEWDRILAVNLRGVFLSMRSEVAAMRDAGEGVIVNTASVASVIAAPGMPAYIASKHGVAGLTKAAALDLAGANIRVNAVCPGFVHTGMTDVMLADSKMAADIAALSPMNRVAQPAEIANAILFLASDQSSFATGSLLMMDGGVSIR